MKLKIIFLIASLAIPLKLYAQPLLNQDNAIAKDLAECTAIFRIFAFIGHSTKPENLNDSLITNDERLFLQENLKKHWNLLFIFIEHYQLTESAYASIHEFYKTSSYRESIGLESNPLEIIAKQEILQGKIHNEWTEKSIKCIYIHDEIKKIKTIKKNDVVNGYSNALIRYSIDMQDKNFKETSFKYFQEISKYSLIAWKNLYKFETLHESNIHGKRMLDNNRHKLVK